MIGGGAAKYVLIPVVVIYFTFLSSWVEETWVTWLSLCQAETFLHASLNLYHKSDVSVEIVISHPRVLGSIPVLTVYVLSWLVLLGSVDVSPWQSGILPQSAGYEFCHIFY